MREATNGPSSLYPPPSYQRSDPKEPSNLDQVDAYMEEDIDLLDEIDHYKRKESEEEEAPHPCHSTTDAGTSTSGIHFTCANWVS